MTPPVGPLSGKTLVRVSGRRLLRGSDYSCRFGHTSVPATLDATSGGGASVTCMSPAGGGPLSAVVRNVSTGEGGRVPFGVAPNSQNSYDVDGDGDDGDEALAAAAAGSAVSSSSLFTYHDSLLLSSVIPPTGPTDGGIALNISGSGLAGGSDYRCCVAAEAQPCTSGACVVCSAIT